VAQKDPHGDEGDGSGYLEKVRKGLSNPFDTFDIHTEHSWVFAERGANHEVTYGYEGGGIRSEIFIPVLWVSASNLLGHPLRSTLLNGDIDECLQNHEIDKYVAALCTSDE
jgi:hypothetical protein